jgi:phosphopantetheine adenylyltransferase
LVRAAHKESASEVEMATMNLRIAGINTVFVPAEPDTRDISSTLVRALVTAGRLSAAQDLVPKCVADALATAPAR